jgi:hypothetical protein
VDSPASAITAQIEALLLEPVLAPMTAAFGEYGDVAKNAFAQALATELERHA